MGDSFTTGSPSSLSFTTKINLIRTLIRPRLPHDIHDYVLEGICKALEGYHVISVVRTGGGKTTYFTGFMILLQELEKASDGHRLKKSLNRTIPQNPLCVVVYPTKGLEEEMAEQFNSLGIPSLAINEDTIRAARNKRIDLWTQAMLPQLRCLLLSPEQLSSKSFNSALSNPTFYSRIIALDVDEIHLILSWGALGFRLCFRDIGNMLMRLPRWTTLTGVTATLSAGADTQVVTQLLGLKPGSFVFTRHSNRRPELQIIFRTLRHGLQGWTFPDFDWILDGRRKTIIYCSTISLAYRLFVYLWRKDTPSNSPSRRKRFRLYCSLYTHQYNKISRDMFVNDRGCQVLISTDALKVGNDFPNVDDAIVVEPQSPDDVLQKGGRAGRKPPFSNPGPRCICYFTESTMKRAKTVSQNGKGEAEDSQQHGKMTAQMAKLLLAKCINDELDVQFDNPAEEPPCGCETCSSFPTTQSRSCQCSRCLPETPLPLLPRKAHIRQSRGPMATRLSDEMRDYGMRSLQSFRDTTWNKCRSPSFRALPPAGLLTDKRIGDILDSFAKIRTIDDLSPHINTFLHGHEQSLLDEILELRRKFDRMAIGLDPEDKRLSSQAPGLYDKFFSSLASTSTPPSILATNNAPPDPSSSSLAPGVPELPVKPRLTIRIPPLSQVKWRSSDAATTSFSKRRKLNNKNNNYNPSKENMVPH
ncbi:P-loop containing nucleoside triphosphate hydrolase protein [Lentinula raphanica]|nr:P-loop containing nucleoside triphosphate hydrolase protein [Lentinula raphanica]